MTKNEAWFVPNFKVCIILKTSKDIFDDLLQNTLEQIQNKNDSIQLKMIPILKLPRFSPHRLGGEKARQI